MNAHFALSASACALLAACGGLIARTEGPPPEATPDAIAADAGAKATPRDAAVSPPLVDADSPVLVGSDAYIDPGLIPCGKLDNNPITCSVNMGNVCCMDYRDSLPLAFDFVGNECKPSDQCGRRLAVECNTPGDCDSRGRAGSVCCAHYADGFLATLRSIRCLPLAECQKERHVLLCDGTSPTPCPEGRCGRIWASPIVETCQ